MRVRLHKSLGPIVSRPKPIGLKNLAGTNVDDKGPNMFGCKLMMSKKIPARDRDLTDRDEHEEPRLTSKQFYYKKPARNRVSTDEEPQLKSKKFYYKNPARNRVSTDEEPHLKSKNTMTVGSVELMSTKGED